MASFAISEKELLDALAASRGPTADPRGAFVVSELATSSGIPDRTIRGRLARLKKLGLVEVLRVTREGIDGRQTPVPAYRLRKATR